MTITNKEEFFKLLEESGVVKIGLEDDDLYIFTKEGIAFSINVDEFYDWKPSK